MPEAVSGGCRIGSTYSISLEYISRIHFILHIIQATVIPVGDDGVGLFLKYFKVIHNLRTKEGLAVLQGGLVDNNVGTLGLDALHDALDSTLAEIVAVGLHRQTEHTNSDFLLGALAPSAVGGVVTGLLQHGIGDVVLTGAVALHNGRHHILGHILVVGQQLFRVLRQTVASVAEARVIIMRTDAGIQADTVDDGLSVQTLHLGIGIQLVEVADTQSQVGIGKEFHGLGLLHAHEETRDALGELRVHEASLHRHPSRLSRVGTSSTLRSTRADVDS